MSDTDDSTSTGDGESDDTSDGDSVPSPFLEFCAKVRSNGPSILPKPGEPFNIRHWQMDEKEHIELADALLENTNVTYLELKTSEYMKSFAEAMAKYIRTSKRLQRIDWHEQMREREEILCCFLHAIQESTSLKELHINLPPIGGLSNLGFENMLKHTQTLRYLSLTFPDCPLEYRAVAAARSGLKKNSTYESSQWNIRGVQ
jgi:hypothetical protein